MLSATGSGSSGPLRGRRSCSLKLSGVDAGSGEEHREGRRFAVVVEHLANRPDRDRRAHRHDRQVYPRPVRRERPPDSARARRGETARSRLARPRRARALVRVAGSAADRVGRSRSACRPRTRRGASAGLSPCARDPPSPHAVRRRRRTARLKSPHGPHRRHGSRGPDDRSRSGASPRFHRAVLTSVAMSPPAAAESAMQPRRRPRRLRLWVPLFLLVLLSPASTRTARR